MDVFVRDLSTTAVEIVSVDNVGVSGSGSSYDPSMSGDGRYVAFHTLAKLSTLDTNTRCDIYVRDRDSGGPSTTLISVNSAGTAAGNNYSYEPRISHDGSTVAFYAESVDETHMLDDVLDEQTELVDEELLELLARVGT